MRGIHSSSPGTAEEKKWLAEHLEVLSIAESDVLAAAVEHSPPATMADAVNHLLTLIYDGQNLGAILDERGQGDRIIWNGFLPRWNSRTAAAWSMR